jgi:tetratricopeptide (TPR) repeat protein
MYLKGSKWSYTRSRKRANPWRIILLIVFIAGLLYINQFVVPTIQPLGVPTSTPTRAPESFVTEGDALIAQGKISQAVTIYKQAVQADPKNVSIYITLARLQIYTGNYKDAKTTAENALVLNPNNAMAHSLRGWAMGFNEDYLEAETALNKAIELDPNNAIGYAYLAEVLANESQSGNASLGTLDRAITTSKKAVALGANLLETHRARGLILELTANYTEAVKEFEAAIALNTNIADLHLALGRNYRFLAQYNKAIDEFNRANALNPSDPLPDTYISRTYATVGEYAKAIQYASQAVKDSPTDPSMHGNLGTMYYRNKLYQDSVKSLRLAVRGGNTDDGQVVKGLPLDYGRIAEFYYTYALGLARVGQCGEALQISQLLQQVVSNDEIAVYNAKEVVNICQQLVSGTTVPSAGATSTPSPKPTATR